MTTPTQLRSELGNLTDLAEDDLEAIWRDTVNREQTAAALRDVLPTLVSFYSLAAGAVAADWYDEYRQDVGARGRFRAIPVEVGSAGALQLADWATTYGNTANSVKSLVIGGMTRRILNGARMTLMTSTQRDPVTQGWMRVGAGACDFCRILIARGAVYTETSANFASHDNCKCQAVPKFPGALPIDVQKYRATTRRRSAETTEKDRARVKQWIADNPNSFPLATL